MDKRTVYGSRKKEETGKRRKSRNFWVGISLALIFAMIGSASGCTRRVDYAGTGREASSSPESASEQSDASSDAAVSSDADASASADDAARDDAGSGLAAQLGADSSVIRWEEQKEYAEDGKTLISIGGDIGGFRRRRRMCIPLSLRGASGKRVWRGW